MILYRWSTLHRDKITVTPFQCILSLKHLAAYKWYYSELIQSLKWALYHLSLFSKLKGNHPLLSICQIEAIDSIFMLALPLNCTIMFPKYTYHPDPKVGLTNKSKNMYNTLEIEPKHIRIKIIWSRINMWYWIE